jgi:hypothetical protein
VILGIGLVKTGTNLASTVETRALGLSLTGPIPGVTAGYLHEKTTLIATNVNVIVDE